jgi:hypothetical protein
MSFRRVSPSVWDSFVRGYRSDRMLLCGWDESAVTDLVRAQMISLLVRAPGQGAEAEWKRRLDGLARLRVPDLA